ncbi:MAG TPA: hypothetical protein VGD66_04320 [Allosphingosinicella sp.]|jgi:hypothetical protein
MHGIILDMYAGEDPVRVSALGSLPELIELETINPDHTAAMWPAGQVQMVQPTSKRSTKTGEMLDGSIVRRSAQ